MVVMCIVCMFINEVVDVVSQGVCSKQDVDLVMQKGVNYLCGLLVWVDVIGVDIVVNVLCQLSVIYGEDCYCVVFLF